eukprot:GHVR01138715.1.p2 GENE.GHVR01138715.1~~GHVR01138715.1.p2  ORF type:complete len:144 (+),score=3.13 GHVR01138715.1:364-795(+)
MATLMHNPIEPMLYFIVDLRKPDSESVEYEDRVAFYRLIKSMLSEISLIANSRKVYVTLVQIFDEEFKVYLILDVHPVENLLHAATKMCFDAESYFSSGKTPKNEGEIVCAGYDAAFHCLQQVLAHIVSSVEISTLQRNRNNR